MRLAAPLTCLVLGACCAAPPRIDDRTRPEDAYRTFRGALARQEWSREYACLSDPLRERLGLRSRLDWNDLRTVLGPRHALFRAIACSHVAGSEREDDGRVRLTVRLPLGYRARVWLRAYPVLRILVEDWDTPVYRILPGLEIPIGPGFVAVRVPKSVLDSLAPELEGERLVGLEARREWFLDDFEVGKHSPRTLRDEKKTKERQE